MKKYRPLVWILIIAGGLILASTAAAHALAPQSVNLAQVSPSACPSGGCAAGQRMNFQIEFDAATPVYAGGPNLQVCVYTPADGESGAGSSPWADPTATTTSTSGGITGIPYSTGEIDSVCSTNLPSTGYTVLTSAHATLTAGGNDRLSLALRINPTTNQAGSVFARVFQVTSPDGATWTANGESSRSVSVASVASTSYVANDAASCGSYSPCFLNSGDDLTGGYGTGLRDANDAVPPLGSVVILGSYQTKTKTVELTLPHTVRGLNNASLSHNGISCSGPILSLQAGTTLSNLTVHGGGCQRSLVAVDTADDITIDSNTFTNGSDVITINALGSMKIRYNQIKNNSGYAIRYVSGSGAFTATANNLYGNRNGTQVSCGSHGQVDHNFWGAGVSTSTSTTGCTVTNGKRLGSPIHLTTGVPGVDALLVTVATAKGSAFSGQIAFSHPSGVADFNLYIVSHGSSGDSAIPFLNNGTDTLVACSNFWDVFLPDSSTPTGLDLFVKYNLNQNCISMINSSLYCGQSSNPALYPLWWYDPQNNGTDRWDTTGQNPAGSGAAGAIGQTTTCNTSSDEIQVTIDQIGRPNLSTDLEALPIAAGLPAATSIVSLTATTGINQNLVQWETSTETKVSGFYVTRSESSGGTYNRTSGLVEAKGNSQIGGIYNYLDTSLRYGTTYYYKLEVVSTDGQTVAFYGPVTAQTATATPTITPTPTITLTPTVTLTRTITPYISPTATRTAVYYYYYTPTRTRTPFYTSTVIQFRTATPNRTLTAQAAGNNLTPQPTNDPNATPVGSATPFSATGYPADNALPTPDTQKPGSPTQTTPSLTKTQTGQTQTSATISTVNHTPISPAPTDLTPQPPPPSESGPGLLAQPVFWVSLLSGALAGFTLLSLTGWLLVRPKP